MNQTTKEKSNKKQTKQLVLWIGALAIGAVLGMFGIGWLNYSNCKSILCSILGGTVSARSRTYND